MPTYITLLRLTSEATKNVKEALLGWVKVFQAAGVSIFGLPG